MLSMSSIKTIKPVKAAIRLPIDRSRARQRRCTAVASLEEASEPKVAR